MVASGTSAVTIWAFVPRWDIPWMRPRRALHRRTLGPQGGERLAVECFVEPLISKLSVGDGDFSAQVERLGRAYFFQQVVNRGIHAADKEGRNRNRPWGTGIGRCFSPMAEAAYVGLRDVGVILQ